MNKGKFILIGGAFVIVLLSGFVFGHYVIKNNTASIKAEEKINRVQYAQDITESRDNAITRTVKSVSSEVVGINVTEVREYRDPFGDMFGNDPFFRQFFGNGNQPMKQEVH